MKTNFEKQKRNNVQKTFLNVAALIISLIILSTTVDAQGIWKSFLEINNANGKDLVMVNETKNPSSVKKADLLKANSNKAYSEQETDEALNLEDWMTNESYFAVNTVETEEALQLEDWMTNENYFIPSSFQLNTVIDSPLELEDWMLNDNYFHSVKNEEQPMALENWMIAENYWK